MTKLEKAAAAYREALAWYRQCRKWRSQTACEAHWREATDIARDAGDKLDRAEHALLVAASEEPNPKKGT